MPLILYFLISLLSASLLFLVQPMAAKTALPILGGSPFVWNGCMVFFQTLLLAGYSYAHLLNKTLPVKRQPLVHLPLLALALFIFPLNFAGSSWIDPATHPLAWLFSMLILSIGLPFFVVSATSPMSQRWFAAAAPMRQPYVLYAASNLGSFLGLLAYPTIVEPFLPLKAQAQTLSYGFYLLLALFALAAWPLRHSANLPMEEKPENNITRRQILSWVTLAFVPSSLLYGVTTYITTDIASMPLFWVIPLGLYLLSFVLVFAAKAPKLKLWNSLHRMGAPAMAFIALLPLTYPVMTLGLHLLIFFAAAMICHSRLAELKPPPQQLTSFFLWVSFGGVLGGLFNSFLAPTLFTTVIEYPLMLVLSLALANGSTKILWPTRHDGGNIVAVWLVYGAIFWLLSPQSPLSPSVVITQPVKLAALLFLGLALMFAGYFLHRSRAWVQVLWVAPALVLVVPIFNLMLEDETAFTGRNLFGVSRVIWQPEKRAWFFRHGTTFHGVQSTDASLRLQPTSYYAPLIDVFTTLPQALSPAPVAVMGMGIGTVACYGAPHQHYDFLEIDPLVERIAHDTRYFTYLRDCVPDIHIATGDGRLSLSRSTDRHYGVIIIDVFSSDAIPLHVLTREAVAMYAGKLKEGGLIAFNISNRHIELLPVLSAIAQANGMAGVWKLTLDVPQGKLQSPSEWVVLARKPAALAPLRAKAWQELPQPDPSYLWRDDYSNILRSMHF